jgi:hypothetical protein
LSFIEEIVFILDHSFLIKEFNDLSIQKTIFQVVFLQQTLHELYLTKGQFGVLKVTAGMTYRSGVVSPVAHYKFIIIF